MPPQTSTKSCWSCRSDICSLFNADRLTIYSIGEDKASIVSKVKTGLNSFKDLRLPIADQSIAGHVALAKKTVNIRDVYDEAELKAINPSLRFLQEVDKRTGYRTKQMLVAPIVDAQSSELLGVVQLINNKAGDAFRSGRRGGCQGAVRDAGDRLHPAQQAGAGRSRQSTISWSRMPSFPRRNWNWRLVPRGARTSTSKKSWSTSSRSSSRPSARHWAKFFDVPYEPFRADRIKPIDLLKNLKREYRRSRASGCPWRRGRKVSWWSAMDPEQVKGSRIVNNVFPRAKIAYRVTTNHEFVQTLDQLFGASGVPGYTDDSSVGDLLSTLDEGEWKVKAWLTMFPPRPTTNWSSWSTRSSSMPTSRVLRTSTSSRAWARTRC